MADIHAMEITSSNNPAFSLPVKNENEAFTTSFELQLLAGSMVHPYATFTVDYKANYLNIEWAQDHLI